MVGARQFVWEQRRIQPTENFTSSHSATRWWCTPVALFGFGQPPSPIGHQNRFSRVLPFPWGIEFNDSLFAPAPEGPLGVGYRQIDMQEFAKNETTRGSAVEPRSAQPQSKLIVFRVENENTVIISIPSTVSTLPVC